MGDVWHQGLSDRLGVGTAERAAAERFIVALRPMLHRSIVKTEDGDPLGNKSILGQSNRPVSTGGSIRCHG